MGKKFISILNYLVHCVIEVIYPFKEECLICNASTEDSSLLCKNCLNKIKFCKESYFVKKNDTRYDCFCLAYYSNIVTELVLRLKYKHDYQCGEALAQLMSNIIINNKMQVDFITFVPCTEKTLKKRGYNQSKLLAKNIGNILNIKILDCLLKVKDTKDQIGLSEEMRWFNLKDSYKLNDNKEVFGKKIILVDDVLTTGATTFLCAEQLIAGKASSVIVLTAAKSKI